MRSFVILLIVLALSGCPGPELSGSSGGSHTPDGTGPTDGGELFSFFDQVTERLTFEREWPHSLMVGVAPVPSGGDCTPAVVVEDQGPVFDGSCPWKGVEGCSGSSARWSWSGACVDDEDGTFVGEWADESGQATGTTEDGTYRWTASSWTEGSATSSWSDGSAEALSGWAWTEDRYTVDAAGVEIGAREREMSFSASDNVDASPLEPLVGGTLEAELVGTWRGVGSGFGQLIEVTLDGSMSWVTPAAVWTVEFDGVDRSSDGMEDSYSGTGRATVRLSPSDGSPTQELVLTWTDQSVRDGCMLAVLDGDDAGCLPENF